MSCSFGGMCDLPKVVYFGSDMICLPGLEYLAHASECQLIGVVSQPDRRQGRGKRMKANPVVAWAREQDGVEVFQPEVPDRSIAQWIAEHGVVVAFVMAYGHFLPKFLRAAPSFGMLNFHGSLLPELRGASPVETAIAEGFSNTGVCLMEVAKKMDAGGVADQEIVLIEPDDQSAAVREKVGRAVVPLLERNLEAAISGGLNFVKQCESKATFCRKITKEDGFVDFSVSARTIRDRFRAFYPWPGCFFDMNGERIKVGEISIDTSVNCDLKGLKPGQVLATNNGLLVATGDGCIVFNELQKPGGRMLPSADFLRGFPIKIGDTLEGSVNLPLVTKES